MKKVKRTKHNAILSPKDLIADESVDPPIKEVQELTELDTTIMTTSTNNVYCSGRLLGTLPWMEEDSL